MQAARKLIAKRGHSRKKQTLCAKNPCGHGWLHYIKNGGKSAICGFTALEVRLMKVTNWCRKLSAAIVAAGIWAPECSPCHQYSIGRS